MKLMIDFTVALLDAVSYFLGSEPMIYLFGIVCFCFIAKTVRSFFP